MHTHNAAATTIDVGDVQAIELVFAAGADDRRYILQPKGTTEDYLSTLKRFPDCQIKTTREHYIDDSDGQWFAFYNVDCFDPPFAIIRARTFESAYEVFETEFEDWLKVEEPDAADYPEDERTYNGNGTYVDTSNVQGHGLTLLSIQVSR